jgi:hypothetical protein
VKTTAFCFPPLKVRAACLLGPEPHQRIGHKKHKNSRWRSNAVQALIGAAFDSLAERFFVFFVANPDRRLNSR